MYNKEIYQEWEMHHDATQLEIKYKFLVKVIDILTIKALIKNVNNQPKQLTDNQLIKDWQEFQLTKTINNFYEIINDASWYKEQLDDSLNIFEKTIFLLSHVINVLKKTNYKANEIEIYFEPRLFLIAQKVLKIKSLEQWAISMSNRVYQTNVDMKNLLNFEIKINEHTINNVIWYLENLCIAFKEITVWYNNLFLIADVTSNDKTIALNIMNHMIVYYLTDFYVKVVFLDSKNRNFSTVYNEVLSTIRYLLDKGEFAINAFKSIAIFISKILADGYIKENDSIIANYLELIKISCSYNNKNYFERLIFQLLDNSNETSSDTNQSYESNNLIEQEHTNLDENSSSLSLTNDDKIENQYEKTNNITTTTSISEDQTNQQALEVVSVASNQPTKHQSYDVNLIDNTKTPEKIIRPTVAFNHQKTTAIPTKSLNQTKLMDVTSRFKAVNDVDDDIQRIIKRKTEAFNHTDNASIKLTEDEKED